MTLYIKSGTAFRVTTEGDLDIRDELPVGTYTVKFNDMQGYFYLQAIEGFNVSGKIYGDTLTRAERILTTFENRPNTTGAMLSGEKGSGKTLMAQILAKEGQKRGMPTIVINEAHSGELFNEFMQTIEQPTVVLFDEFEKVYPAQQQEELLTLLDGVYPSKKLFILTCNDKYRVDSHMKNRPGRIFYRIEYKGLGTDFITEYCQDNLDNKDHIETICRLSLMFGEFNFDILKALVEEMNRYNETPQEAMALLNAKPEYSDTVSFTVELKVGEKAIDNNALYEKKWKGNPLSGEIRVMHRVPDPKDPDDWNWENEHFNPSHLVNVDSNSGQFLFVNDKGANLSLTRLETPTYDHSLLF